MLYTHARAHKHTDTTTTTTTTRARSDARPNARARTIVLLIPLAPTCPRRTCFFPLGHSCPPSPLLPTYAGRSFSRSHSSLLLFFSVTPLSLSHRRHWRCLRTPQRLATFHPRSDAAGTKARSLITRRGLRSLARDFPSKSSPFSNAYSRCRNVPAICETRAAFSCRENRDSTSGADCRGSVEPTRTLLHRHAPVLRAADSAETSHGTPRSVCIRCTPFAIRYVSLAHFPSSTPAKPSRVYASKTILMNAPAGLMKIADFFASADFETKRRYPTQRDVTGRDQCSTVQGS